MCRVIGCGSFSGSLYFARFVQDADHKFTAVNSGTSQNRTELSEKARPSCRSPPLSREYSCRNYIMSYWSLFYT